MQLSRNSTLWDSLNIKEKVANVIIVILVFAMLIQAIINIYIFWVKKRMQNVWLLVFYICSLATLASKTLITFT